MATIVTKHCSVCNKEKDIEEFYLITKKYKVKDGSTRVTNRRMSKCKDCHTSFNSRYKDDRKEFSRKYYIDNIEHCKKKSISWNIKYRQLWWDVAATVIDLECEECGYDKHSAALDFHHITPEKKETSIHKIMSDLSPTTDRNIEMFINELDKCVVLCSNCHREHHAKYNYLYSGGIV